MILPEVAAIALPYEPQEWPELPYGVRYPQDLIDYIEESMRLQAKFTAGAKK